MTKQERDHLRYMAHQSERQAKQRDYYQAHKEELKRKRREKFLKDLEAKYARREQQDTITG